MFISLIIILALLGLSTTTGLLILHQLKNQKEEPLDLKLQSLEQNLKAALQEKMAQNRQDLIEKLGDNHIKSLQILQEGLQKGRLETSEQVKTALFDSAKSLSERIEKLTDSTENKLKEISGQVDKRLSEGFEKTTITFADVVKRLALIDQAQQKISELSGNVVSLQDLLADKRSRGAFGEIQLASLIRNVLPESSFALQATLSNSSRADCLLYLPEPTGNIVIDSKFPLENFQRLMNSSISEADKKLAEQQFRQDIKKHIKDISEKYIINGETSDGAIMFIPAEAIFAEIHAHYPDLVEASYRAKVWLASPTTMMAILTTVRAVLKDDATKKQVHNIQKHIQALSKDFDRFQGRMDALQKHIELANKDVNEVNISAKKISGAFDKIEKVELQANNMLSVDDLLGMDSETEQK
ncbi:MAG: RmuC family protein [Gammaproteobacteria bacterium]|jgi:DNA recombination protein RmuC|nr:RmuC family protein [Gammaproteobacteria bacterium]